MKNYLVFDGNRLLAEFKTEIEANRFVREFRHRNKHADFDLHVVKCLGGAE